MSKTSRCPDLIHHGSTNRERVMTCLALLFLILTAFSLHHFNRTPQDVETGRLLGWCFLVLWLPLFLEALEGYWRQGDYTWSSARRLLLLWLIPPYRLAVTTYPAGNCVWFPGLGWQRADQDFFELLERAFSVPMLFIALLILPILAVELFWAKQVQAYPVIGVALDLGTALIWLAFAVEFIVMSTVARKKLVYVVKHWINLAIILLPFLAFVRGFQVIRMLRFGKALKVYRLRGLGLRAWQGLVALEVMERVLHREPESRLQHLREVLKEKEQEAQRIRKRICDMEEEHGLAEKKEAGE